MTTIQTEFPITKIEPPKARELFAAGGLAWDAQLAQQVATAVVVTCATKSWRSLIPSESVPHFVEAARAAQRAAA